MPIAISSNYEQDKPLITRFLAGESQTSIAQNLGLTRERVRQRLKRNGFSGRNYRWIPSQDNILAALRDSNSSSHAAELLNLSELQLHTAVNYHGLLVEYFDARNHWKAQQREEYYLARQQPFVSQIRNLARRIGHTPRQQDLQQNNISHMTLIRTFGSLADAMIVAGLKPNPHYGVSPLPQDFELIDDTTVDVDEVRRRANLLLLTDAVNAEPPGVEIPQRVERTSSVYYRDPKVVAWILKNANGFCELCGVQGYETIVGDLYLEVHHVIPLKSGGSDKISNGVAVCEICHGKLHRAKGRDELNALLYSKIERLIRIQE